MKIAQITSTFPPYKGGIGNVAYHHARKLAERGHDVTVITPDYKDRPKLEGQPFDIKYLKPLISYGNSALSLKLSKALGDFDVVHLHYPFFGGAELTALAKWRLNKLVMTYHMDVVGSGALSLFFKLHSKTLLPGIVRSADKIIATSIDYVAHSNIKKYFESHPEKFEELANGVDINRFSPQPKNAELVKKLQLAPQVILFVGGLDQAHYFKGLENLIRSLGHLTGLNYTLVVVGDGEMKGYYKKVAEIVGVDERVRFAGSVSDQDLPKYYNLADVAVLPSIDKSEAFGMVLVEAMACGKPVVASNLAGVRTVVDNGKNGFLVRPQDPASLGKILYSMLEDRPGLQALGEMGRKKAVEEYSWDKLADKLEKIYSSK